jgi:curved DNA-binding protein CbpA
MPDHYETLGVPRDASAADIKSAWRRLAATEHPDKGGDAERMAAINRANDVLGDPDKRAEYDATGQCDGEDRLENEARSNLAGMFTAVLDNGSDAPDIIGDTRDLLSQARMQIDQHLAAAKHRVARLTKQRNRVRTKKGATNLFQGLVDQQIRDLDQQIAQMEHGRTVFKRVGELLDDHEMAPDEALLALQNIGMRAAQTAQGGAWFNMHNPWGAR